MSRWTTLLLLTLPACDDDVGTSTEPVFFVDTAGPFARDSDGDPCLTAWQHYWPKLARVDPATSPEVLLAPGAGVLRTSWRTSDNQPIAHTHEVVSLGATAAVRLLPDAPLAAHLDTMWGVEFANEPSSSLCPYGLASVLNTGPRGTLATPAEIDGRSWWIPLDERNDSSGILLGRLIARTGPAAGRALALSVRGPQLWIGSVVRAPSLPTDPCDTTDLLALSNRTAALQATAERVTLEDPTTPLTLRALALDGLVTEGGDRLEGVNLRASLDVSGLDEGTRTTFCALAEESGRPCAPCDEAEPASQCIPIDARGLDGAALDAGLARVADGIACAR